MPGTEEAKEIARLTHQLRLPALKSAIDALDLPGSSHGLDAGCGIGLQAQMLAEAVGASGRVTGVDAAKELVEHARVLAADADLADRLTFRTGDVHSLPLDDDSFDWAWSADCIGYAPMEPLPMVEELARVVRPGGTVAILAWSHETLLPGHPALEARLRGTPAGLAPFAAGKDPSLHFLRALGWFREIGLRDLSARTLVGDVHAPLSPDIRRALEMLFDMRWPGVESELAEAETAEYRRLCLRGSPDFILQRPDYYAFFTYSMFSGRVPAE